MVSTVDGSLKRGERLGRWSGYRDEAVEVRCRGRHWPTGSTPSHSQYAIDTGYVQHR